MMKKQVMGDPYEGLNRTSVDALLDMGFEREQIVEALTYLKKQRDHNPIGEIDKALDLLQRSSRSHHGGNAAGSGNVLKLQVP